MNLMGVRNILTLNALKWYHDTSNRYYMAEKEIEPTNHDLSSHIATAPTLWLPSLFQGISLPA